MIVLRDCTSDSSTTCRPCVDQTYMDEPNGLNRCSQCKICDSGEIHFPKYINFQKKKIVMPVNLLFQGMGFMSSENVPQLATQSVMFWMDFIVKAIQEIMNAASQ